MPAAAPRGYFAEGSQGFFDTFVLIGNPQANPVDVTLTFLREGETTVTHTEHMDPFSRKTVSTATIPELVNRSFGVIVDATLPVVAERAMYFGSTATRPWSGGGDAAGATAPSADWYFAEGATGSFFDTFILMMNPEAQNDAHATLRYLLDTGETIEVPKVIPASRRITVNIEAEDDARLRNATMSARLTSDRPIVAERAVYWPTARRRAAVGRIARHPGRHRRGFALGAGGGTHGRTAELPHLHPAGKSQHAGGGRDGGVPAADGLAGPEDLPRGGGKPLHDRRDVRSADDPEQLVHHAALDGGRRPIVVERSLYWDGAGLTWSGGSSAVATRLPEPPE